MSTFTAFFYGTLMHPKILKQVIMNDASHLHFCPAVLLDYTRHRIKGQHYPGIIPASIGEKLVNKVLDESDKSVRGTLVSGLTESDIALLDAFEDDEYDRVKVKVRPLATLASISAHPGGDEELILLHATPLPNAKDLAPPVEADTYVWTKIGLLEPQLWSFDDFVKNNAYRWFDYRPEAINERK